MNKNIKYIIGIDEVGRGPLAGPVAIGAFKMPVNFDGKYFLPRQIGFSFDWGGKIKDSKKLSQEKREEIAGKLKKLKKEKIIDYSVCYQSSRQIDKLGLSKAIKNCIENGMKKLKVKPQDCLVLLDGGLKAPVRFKNQKTIIKGDEKERAIAFASIVAKVSRDTLMCRLSKKYPEYYFEIHKGYGTKKHRDLIAKYGLSYEHRKSFCRGFYE